MRLADGREEKNKFVNTLDRCPKSMVLFTDCFNRRTKFCEIIHLSGGIELDIFRVSFIGHRVVDEYRQVEEELDEVIELLHCDIFLRTL